MELEPGPVSKVERRPPKAVTVLGVADVRHLLQISDDAINSVLYLIKNAKERLQRKTHGKAFATEHFFRTALYELVVTGVLILDPLVPLRVVTVEDVRLYQQLERNAAGGTEVVHYAEHVNRLDFGDHRLLVAYYSAPDYSRSEHRPPCSAAYDHFIHMREYVETVLAIMRRNLQRPVYQISGENMNSVLSARVQGITEAYNMIVGPTGNINAGFGESRVFIGKAEDLRQLHREQQMHLRREEQEARPFSSVRSDVYQHFAIDEPSTKRAKDLNEPVLRDHGTTFASLPETHASDHIAETLNQFCAAICNAFHVDFFHLSNKRVGLLGDHTQQFIDSLVHAVVQMCSLVDWPELSVGEASATVHHIAMQTPQELMLAFQAGFIDQTTAQLILGVPQKAIVPPMLLPEASAGGSSSSKRDAADKRSSNSQSSTMRAVSHHSGVTQ